MPVWKESTQSSRIKTKQGKVHGKAQKPANQIIQLLPPINGILILNDDCLLHIMSFVDIDDILRLHQVHQRFKVLFPIAARFLWRKETIYIDDQALKRYPWVFHRSLFEAVGSNIKDLDVQVNSERKFISILKYFPNLEHLAIVDTELANIASINQFPPLKSLWLDSPNISLHYIKRLFRHLDKTLAKLNYPLPLYMQCLLLLHNLKEIRIPIEGVKRGFKGKKTIWDCSYHFKIFIQNYSYKKLFKKTIVSTVPTVRITHSCVHTSLFS